MSDVGGLNASAQEWRRLHTELDRAQKERADADARCSTILARMHGHSKLLSERVGPNVPMKAFRVDDGVVIVELDKPIRFVPFEDEEQ